MRFTLCAHSFHFTICFLKSISTSIFLILEKIAEIGKVPLWYHSCLWKLWDTTQGLWTYLLLFSLKTPLGYDQSLMQTFYIMICYIWLGDSASSRTPNNRGIILTIIHLAIRLYHFGKITLDQKFILLLSEWFQSTISTWISWLFSWWSKLGP
jgi:hypothetical protein